MNSLIIIAHPKQESFSFAIAKKYEKLAKDKGYDVQVIDLYRDNHQQPFYYFADATEVAKTPEIKYYQE